MSLTRFLSLVIITFTLLSFRSDEDKINIKYLIQMIPYQGEAAYVVISLVDENDAYTETLFVQGDDPEWWYDIDSWWSFQENSNQDLDGITGATIEGGQRAVNRISINADKLNQGYSIRFESIVEDQDYHIDDVRIPFTSEGLKQKYEGKGYIKYVRLSVQ